MVATVIAVLAVVGLAYAFSAGRGLIDRYATGRAALAVAEERMERLSILGLKTPNDTALAVSPSPVHGPYSRVLNGNPTGWEKWTVTWIDDVADDTPSDPDRNDYKRVTVEVGWTSGNAQDRVQLSRVILGY